MRVEKPRFDRDGELETCADCPWSDELGVTLGLGELSDGCSSGTCPNRDNYDSECAKACRLAEQAEKGE